MPSLMTHVIAAYAMVMPLPDLETTQQEAVFYSAVDSIKALTDTIYLEARGEVPRCQRAVADTIINRAYEDDKSIVQEVRLGYESDPLKTLITLDNNVEQNAYKVAALTASQAFLQSDADESGGANHFYDISIPDPWPSMFTTMKCGRLVFKTNQFIPPED